MLTVRKVKGGKENTEMWESSQIICMGILVILSIADIRFRKVPSGILLLCGVAGIIYQLVQRPVDSWLAAGGVGVGILFLLLSRCTREGIGYGDSLAILVLGIYLGFWGLLEVLAGAFFLLLPVGILCLIRNRMSRKKTIPFYPFLAAGYLMSVLVKGV